MRNGLYDGGDDLRQGLNERNQQVDACLDNLRDSVQHGIDDSINDFRNGFHDCHDDLRQCGNKRGQKLNACFDNLRDGVQQKGNDAVDDLRQSGDQHGYCVQKPLRQPCYKL